MRDPLLRCFSSLPSSTDSWFLRVRDNLRQLFTAAPLFPSSANGAPIHLLEHKGSPRIIRAQTVSLLTHAAMIAILAFAAMHIYKSAKPAGTGVTTVQPHPKFPRGLLARELGLRPDDGVGSGGGRTPIPTTAGNLVPASSIQLVKPSLPVKREAQILVPPTILDLSAAPVLTFVDKIGLPWMQDDTNSPGPGDSNTIGGSRGNTMGDSEKDGPGGQGSSSGKYSPGVTWPKCAYCPDPTYTDEARETKLQGAVTLHVLVGADGRASQIRIVHGIGLGLDERAVQAIRGWKFVPAQDASRRPVPAWVTVEAVFRLF
jgi:protein TonB